MKVEGMLQLKALIKPGEIFHHFEHDRIEAYLPTQFESNHGASLVELNNGDLLCTWFAGSNEGSADIKIVMSRLPKDGQAWSEPVLVSDDYSSAEQNPSIYEDVNGRLWLMHTAMATRGCTLEEWQSKLAKGEVEGSYAMQDTSVVRRRFSVDQGVSWGEPDILFGKPGSFCRHPIQVLSNGDWIVGLWFSQEGMADFGSDPSSVYISQDQGQTWTEYEIPDSNGRVHPSIIETEPGNLVVFFRSRNADFIYVSRSNDYGRSWTSPERTELPNNNASIRAIKLNSGSIAIVFNNCKANDDPKVVLWPYERYPVTIAISEDNGLTWPYRRHIETGDNYCGDLNKKANRRYEYPYLIQAKDGLIHIAYSYGNRESIKHIAITENWVKGAATSNWPWANFPMR
jgi:predicted neuraminidase